MAFSCFLEPQLLVGLELFFPAFPSLWDSHKFCSILKPLSAWLLSFSFCATCWEEASRRNPSVGLSALYLAFLCISPFKFWLLGNSELQVLALQLEGLPHLCWLLCILVASFHFASQIFASCQTLANAPRRKEVCRNLCSPQWTFLLSGTCLLKS